jgi:hypothetical protein
MRRSLLLPSALFCLAATLHASAQQQLATPKLVVPSFGMGSSLIQLALRSEVQNELGMSLPQRNAVAELDPRKNMPTRPARQREQRFEGGDQDIQRHLDSTVIAQRNAGDEKLKSILKPEQMKRLLQLDLQWRGPLAMADPRVAERLDIASAHRTKINDISAEFNQVRAELLSEAMHIDQSAPGIIRVDTKDMDNPLTPVGKKYAGAKKSAEDKILKLLSAEEKARWKQSQGEEFVFRKDRPGAK